MASFLVRSAEEFGQPLRGPRTNPPSSDIAGGVQAQRLGAIGAAGVARGTVDGTTFASAASPAGRWPRSGRTLDRWGVAGTPRATGTSYRV
ncbi:MAG: hypothetical protein M3276_08880 [Actinomycetota bacterium]|nr:hypothetical protein [Actinomycetota bacterium]